MVEVCQLVCSLWPTISISGMGGINQDEDVCIGGSLRESY